MVSYRRIAALGSSFAAGPGIEPTIDADAMRSGRNYPHLFADLITAQLFDMTVAGATTETITARNQITMSGHSFPPQVDGLPPDVEIITVTAGGNDLGFSLSMLTTAWSNVRPSDAITEFLRTQMGDQIPEPTQRDIDRTSAGLGRVVAEARQRGPRARVVLVDYLTVIGADTGPAVGAIFGRDQVAAFTCIQAALIEAYQQAAVNSDADLLRVSELSRVHGLGSADPWVFPFEPTPERAASSFHPNLRGMQAIAAFLAHRYGHGASA